MDFLANYKPDVGLYFQETPCRIPGEAGVGVLVILYNMNYKYYYQLLI